MSSCIAEIIEEKPPIFIPGASGASEGLEYSDASADTAIGDNGAADKDAITLDSWTV